MISWLKGKVIEREAEHLVLDVNGVGYELQCSLSTLSAVSVGDSAQFFAITHAREDALILFGFASRKERAMFQALVKVNGVGPKMAIKILSGASVDQISDMIENSDVKGLSSLPKVGKKTAEQLIVSLKGKLPEGETTHIPIKTTEGSLFRNLSGSKAEIFSALVHLGFRAQDVEGWVTKLPEGFEFEEGVRRGLREMTTV